MTVKMYLFTLVSRGGSMIRNIHLELHSLFLISGTTLVRRFVGRNKITPIRSSLAIAELGCKTKSSLEIALVSGIRFKLAL